MELVAGEDGIQAETVLTISSGSYMITSGGGSGVKPSDDVSAKGLKAGTTLTLTGGTLLTAGSGGMSQTPSGVSQCAISPGFDSTLPEGTFVSFAGKDQSFVLELPISASSIVLSSPDLKSGAACTVSYGGDYSGESVDGICSGGACSGGTDLTALTLSDSITTYGSRGNMSGMGGRTDKNMGNEQRGGKNRLPAGGEVPEKFPNGDLPQNGNMPGGRGELNGAEKGAGRTKPSTGSTPSLT